MIAHMEVGVGKDDQRVEAIMEKARLLGLVPEVHTAPGDSATPVEIYLRDGKRIKASSVPEYPFQSMPSVRQVVRVSVAEVSPLMNGDGGRHIIGIGSQSIGPGHPCLLVAGHCADDVHTPRTVEVLARQGVRNIRTGFRKPRSSADSFRGFGAIALKRTFQAAKDCDMKSVWMEVIESPDIEEVLRMRDEVGYSGEVILWVGARNGNYRLLEALGKQDDFMVMLKHGLNMKSIDELMNLAGFVLAGPMFWNEKGALDEGRSLMSGNNRLLLCIRGLENTDKHDPHRFAPNFGWLDALHERCWANTVLDPSHMGGSIELVLSCLLEGLTHNPDVVLVESHIKPEVALCDANQAIPAERIDEVLRMVDGHNESIKV